jgi:4-amino-4-deoxy-L-arabinose transferase-like glycosyltransferase
MTTRHRVRLAAAAALFVLLASTGLFDHFFRDEFYYLACSHRLAWGYVDQPPLSIAILWIVRHLAGDSLLVLRMSAAAAAAASIWITGSIAQRLGAGVYGEAIAMTATAVAPELLAVGSFFSMNVFDVLLWTLAARLMIDAVEQPADRRWITLGVVLGLGLLNKISMAWIAGGFAAGLVVSPARRLLWTRGPWIAGLVAGVIFLPHVAWQIHHGWPTLEFIRNASRDKMQVNTPLAFVKDQILNMQPVTLPVWGAGLWFLLRGRRGAADRVLGIAFLSVAVLLILNRTSRSAYLAAGYPMLFAAGGVVWERWLRGRALRVTVLAVLVVAGAVTAPLAIPLLPVETHVRYSAALGVGPATEEKQELGRLSQFFADRQGWDRFVDQVAQAWDRLPPADRAGAVVFAGNYGEAGAIEHLGRARGLRVVSAHNNYWLWGPQGHSGDVMLVLSRSPERLRERFASVEAVGETDCGDCMPYENHLPIYLCRGLHPSLGEQWAALKHYN